MRMPRTILLVLVASTLAFARHAKISGDLEQADPSSMVDVIVQFKQPPTEAHHRRIRSRGGVYKKSLDLVKGSLYSVPAGALAAIAEDPNVAYIAPDRPVTAMLDITAQTVNANIALQYGWDGTGIGVAVIDSGITVQPDLQSATNQWGSGQWGNGQWGSWGSAAGQARIAYSQDFVGGGTSDYYGHGTHVAGILGGNGSQSSGRSYTRNLRGIAPNVNIINLRVLDQNGAGTDSTVITAIQAAIQLKHTYNIKVINLSLGRPVFESYTVDPLCQAVEQAWKAGIVVVVAAGNSGRNNSAGTNGYATINAPGNDPYVITVGAMKTEGTPNRSDDKIASYSSKGPTLVDHIVKPDIVAPGNRVVSVLASTASLPHTYPQTLIPMNYYESNGGSTPSSDYFVLSGTSMATPVVSGAVALMLQQDPWLDPDTIKARLMKTATKSFPSYSTATDPVTGTTYTSQYDIFTVGAGYIDIWAALNNSDDVPDGQAALSPVAHYDSKSGQYSVVFGTTYLWGDTLLWGTSMVWGSNVLVNGSGVAGQTLIWGSSAIHGLDLIWGDSMVWGTSNQTSSEAVLVNGEN